MTSKALVIIGDVEVGKTCLCELWKESICTEEYVKTIGVDLITKKIVHEGKDVYVKMWDSSGQVIFLK
jgi:small GTP-binding protein